MLNLFAPRKPTIQSKYAKGSRRLYRHLMVKVKFWVCYQQSVRLLLRQFENLTSSNTLQIKLGRFARHALLLYAVLQPNTRSVCSMKTTLTHPSSLCFVMLAANWQCKSGTFTSQFYQSLLNLNPAMTGVMNCNHRIVANYRNQWASIPKTMPTISIRSLTTRNDGRPLRDTGIMVMVWGDKAAFPEFGTLQARLSVRILCQRWWLPQKPTICVGRRHGRKPAQYQ